MKKIHFRCEFTILVNQDAYDLYVNGNTVTPDGAEAFISAIDGDAVVITVDNQEVEPILDWTL